MKASEGEDAGENDKKKKKKKNKTNKKKGTQNEASGPKSETLFD